MTENIREQVKQVLKARDISQADLARALNKEPQAINRALNGHTSGGSVPPIWKNILETLDLELTAVPRAADNG